MVSVDRCIHVGLRCNYVLFCAVSQIVYDLLHKNFYMTANDSEQFFDMITKLQQLVWKLSCRRETAQRFVIKWQLSILG